MCIKSLNEAFEEKLFNFMLLNFRYFVFCHPTPHQSIVDLRFFNSLIFIFSQFSVISKI